jgi:hypothetical protein
MKKLTILAALLAMLLVAFTPLVLAQQTPPSDVPADSGAIPTLITPAAGSLRCLMDRRRLSSCRLTERRFC